MSVSFNKFNQFVEDMAHGVHDLKTGTAQVLKVMLTNTAPVAGNAVKADITEISAGSGYSAGGSSVGTITGGQSGGVFKLVGATDPTWTAAGGNIGPFRYAVLYNDSVATPVKPLVGWYDRGNSVTLDGTNGDSVTLDLDQTNGIITVT